MEKIIIYAAEGCPKCSMLKKQLDNKQIPYEACYDIDYMLSRGFTHVPILEVDGVDMKFKDALNWINGR